MHFKKIVIAVAAALMTTASSVAAPLHVSAELDSTVLIMGHQTIMRVTVNQAKGEKGNFPLFRQIKENGIIGVCGDSVELRAPVRIDTIEKDGRLKIDYQIPVQSFDSGFYNLPELEFAIGKDTVRSQSLHLKVVPVLVDAETPIIDYANVSDPENPSIFDSVPDWMIDYWWIILILLLAIAAFVFAWVKYKKDGSLLPKKPRPSPYEVAIASLESLKSQKLWENGLEKEYYTDLTDILRKYMYGRFGINAMEMTSRQILGAMKSNKELKDKRNYIRQILNMADFVKFAKVRPLPDDNIESFDNALKFVKETKPVPVEPENPETTPQSNGNSGKGLKKIKKGGKA